MLDLTKPLLTNLSGEWEPCELGKQDGKLYGIYYKRPGDAFMLHSWVGAGNLKNQGQVFKKKFWILMYKDGRMYFAVEQPVKEGEDDFQVREFELEWEG